MFIDTHAHYNLPAYDQDRDEVFERILAVGIGKVICPAVSFDSNHQMMGCLDAYEDVSFAVGMHPKHVCRIRKDKRKAQAMPNLGRLKASYVDRLQTLERLERELASIRELAFSGGRVVAVGETGLDYSLNPGELERTIQMAVFREQVQIALQARLPLVLHVRGAHRDAVRILQSYHTRLKGTVHCFCLGPNEAEDCLALGLMLGIGGKVTHTAQAGLREAVKIAPLDRIVLETDAPYVLPQGSTLSRNDSTAIPVIAREVAKLRGISVEEVERATTENAERLFFADGRS